MNYTDFINRVHARAHLDSTEQAVSAVRATLETLAERIHPGEAKDVASQLPNELAGYLLKHRASPERFTADEFVQRIGLREQCDSATAQSHARGVIGVLEEALSPGELHDLRSELPLDFDSFFTTARDEKSEAAG